MLDFSVGADVRSGSLETTTSGAGARPGTAFEVTVHSVATVLGTGTVDGQGGFGGSYRLPADLAAGVHEVAATATAANGSPLTAQAWFSVDASGSVTAISYDGPTPDPGSVLPRTGSDPHSLIVAGVGLGLFGAAAAAVAARRRTL